MNDDEPRQRRVAGLEGLPPAPPMSPRKWATYLQYRAVWAAAARLPDALAWRAPDPIGDVWYRLAPRRQRNQVRSNQARAAGRSPRRELDRLVRDAYRSYARYWLDSFRVHTLDPDDVLARTEDVNTRILDEVRSDGRGAILATGHLGSWEIGAFFSTQRDWRLTVVAELLEPRRLFDRFVELRRALGLEVIPLVRGGDAVGRLEQVVRDGGTATLLADRDLTGTGPIVTFFGEPCRMPPGPAALARRTGRPVVPGACFTTPRGWRAVVHEPLDIAHLPVLDGTQQIAQALERLIGLAPEQWHVFVPNWLVDREPDHSLLRGGDDREPPISGEPR
ncbi:MAG: phosphatidylinositol mannoside acyltransferase [Actinobacteria bacterium]|nr:phosphatidylinositol mannoside acyltransferase [Actinomycetota bacterium]